MYGGKIGVVGCGTMGAGIAIVMARSGFQTVVQDVNVERINDGFTRISGFFEGGVKRGKFSSEDKDRYLSNIHMTTKVEDFAECDYVVEAIFEDVGIRGCFKKPKTDEATERVSPFFLPSEGLIAPRRMVSKRQNEI